jgi:hypothetical protein
MQFGDFEAIVDAQSARPRRELTPEEKAYLREYPILLDWFASFRREWTGNRVRLAGLAVYGWMPTILRAEKKLRAEGEIEPFFDDIARRLNDEENEFPVSSWNFLNSSYVGTSKFLHFWSPTTFAIWDSRICKTLHRHGRANDPKLFADYKKNITRYSEERTISVREIETVLFLASKSDGET